MSDTLEKCQHEGIHWYPTIKVEKYSPDQAEYAQRIVNEELSWGRRLLIGHLGIRTPRLHGDLLRQLFSAPEDGIATAEGNQLVNGGLTSIAYLLFGTTPSSGNGVQLKPGASGANFQTSGTQQTGCGVGVDTTTFAVTQAHLANTTGEGATASYYELMDSTYPQWQGSGTPGQLNGQATFGTSNANFAWNEWCWFTGTSTFTAGSTLASVATTTNMWNRKVTSLGTKASGASWVFTQTVTFS